MLFSGCLGVEKGCLWSSCMRVVLGNFRWAMVVVGGRKKVGSGFYDDCHWALQGTCTVGEGGFV